MADFPHLKLPIKVEGIVKPTGGGGGSQPNERTLQNRQNRQAHGNSLIQGATTLSNNWNAMVERKEEEGMATPNKVDIPVFLEIDANVFDVNSLKNWGIQLISEENEGFIIGASFDNLELFKKNIGEFLAEKGRYKDTAAKIWSFASNAGWRVDQIVKGTLKDDWQNIIPDQTYVIEIGVSCPVGQLKDYPNRSDFDSEEVFEQKVAEYRQEEQAMWEERDSRQRERENEIENYIDFYNGELFDIWDNGVDAVFFKLAVSGTALKDIILTYQFLFEAKFPSVFNVENDENIPTDDTELEILPPDESATKVYVIDSGIQEQHRLISSAIDSASSKSYVEGDTSTADLVRISGHGTKVAGAILYPRSIPQNGSYKLETIIQNARILDRHNRISNERFSPTLVETIVNDFSPTRIFNLSVCDDCCSNSTHMPPLAASIDKLMHEKDILFIISAGNLYTSNSSNSSNPGILEHLQAGRNYPDYLDQESSSIASPGVSSFAITVGSIGYGNFEDENYKAIAGSDQVSPFSRTGLGMWKVIKPDVVEYGGDLLKHKTSNQVISHESVSCELVNSTLHGASAYSKDSFGTSFSAPKVSYILSKLAAEHPNETAQMYRALIVQSARLPAHCFSNPTHNDIRYYGYGIPDIDRALNNSSRRITFIQNGHLGAKKADVYNINIPSELRGEGKNFSFLIEVTLAFTAKIRQTRKGAHSYLATWLEWKSSRYNEGFGSFRNRTIEYLDNDGLNDTVDDGEGAIKWCLRENPAWTNNSINRNNSTVQKSWVEVFPHQFAETFSLAVVGHSGWDKNLEHEIPYALCVSFEILNSEINIYSLMSEAQVPVNINEAEVEV